jgi:hypothetical protein
MRFPEWLYRLLPGDAGSQQLGVVWREASAGNAVDTTLGVSIYTVPNDKCLVLTNMTSRIRPGAAQTRTRTRFMADPPAGNTRYDFLTDTQALAGGVWSSPNWQGEVIVPGGWRVRVETDFSSAVAQNNIEAEIHGYLIPRGTFVFG